MAWYLTQAVGIEGYDAANNRTLYRTRVYLNASGYNAYGGYSTSGGGSVDGQGFTFGGPSDVSLNNSGQEVYTGTFWVYGDANGYKGGVYADSWFNGGGGWAPGYITASASAGGFDFDRRPSQPATVTPVVNSDKTITVTVAPVSSPAGTPTYYVLYSLNGGAYTGTRYSTSNVITFDNMQRGANYTFAAYATNSDGTSNTTYSSSVFLSAGGKRWDGFIQQLLSVVRRWSGSGWVDCTIARRWNGSNWQDLS